VGDYLARGFAKGISAPGWHASALDESPVAPGTYRLLGLLLVLGAIFFFVAFAANRLLSRRVPSAGKGASYECGIDPVGGDWAQTQVRYYVYAYLYVLFAVESVFLFPWAIVYAKLGMTTVVEMVIFVAVLALGLLYAWRKRVLRWT
jgi:NADH-quinone oxidoreductase subunit A